MSRPRVIVVTGSSSGIGRAIALQSARSASHILVHGCQNLLGLQSIAAELMQAGAKVRAVKMDLSQAMNHARLVDLAFQWQGRVDGWVNAAGADVLTSKHRVLPFEQKLELLWATDVVATIALSRMAAKRMQVQEEGTGIPSILNVGWDQAEQGMEGDSGQYFSATKSAIMAFTRSLSKSVGPKVRANCVAPGWIQTAWGANASSDWEKRARGESCMLRWGTPEDVAHAAQYLLSAEASFISGQTLAVNGGWKPSSP